MIDATGYAGVIVLMALESMCLPLPSEIIMPFAGYLVSTDRLDLFWTATAGAVGCNLGSTIAYYIGAWGEKKFVERWGKFLLITPDDVALAEKFFQRFGSITVFVGRLLPVVRSFVAFPAGFARMNMVKFQIYTFVGSWIWCFGLAWLGMRLGDKWASDPSLREWMHGADVIIGGLLVVGIAWWVWRHVKAARGGPK